MRPIDADALLKRLSLWLDDYDFIIFESVKDDINNTPTVDAVEVVRCKDCKYCDRGNCTFWDDGYGAIVSMEDFCSQGERRENAEAD